MESLDVLYYVAAASIGLLAIFLAWMLYYVVRILKNAVYTVEKFTTVMKKFDEVLDLAKDKLHSSGTYLALAAEAIKSVVEFVGEKKSSSRKRSKKSKK